jgi:hypothetical protein
LVSFDRYKQDLTPCQILTWVLYLGLEKQGSTFQKLELKPVEFFKKVSKRRSVFKLRLLRIERFKGLGAPGDLHRYITSL